MTRSNLNIRVPHDSSPSFLLEKFPPPPENLHRFLSRKLGCQLFVERYAFALSIVFTVHVAQLVVVEIYAPYVPEIGDYTTNVSRSLHRIFALKGAPRGERRDRLEQLCNASH